MSKPMSEQMQKVAARYEKATGKKFDQKTNADHIRSMTDEEFAALWVEPFCDRRTSEQCKRIYHGDCIACVLDWLKQPYKEAEDG